MIAAAYAALPTPTPAQAATGTRLWRTLMAQVSSYEHWFGEGMPSEWLAALETIQATVSAAKREALLEAQQRAQAEAARQGELF